MFVGHPQRAKSIQAVKVKKNKAGGKTSPCSSAILPQPKCPLMGAQKRLRSLMAMGIFQFFPTIPSGHPDSLL